MIYYVSFHLSGKPAAGDIIKKIRERRERSDLLSHMRRELPPSACSDLLSHMRRELPPSACSDLLSLHPHVALRTHLEQIL